MRGLLGVNGIGTGGSLKEWIAEKIDIKTDDSCHTNLYSGGLAFGKACVVLTSYQGLVHLMAERRHIVENIIEPLHPQTSLRTYPKPSS